jgi:hypothetical protein
MAWVNDVGLFKITECQLQLIQCFIGIADVVEVIRLTGGQCPTIYREAVCLPQTDLAVEISPSILSKLISVGSDVNESLYIRTASSRSPD